MSSCAFPSPFFPSAILNMPRVDPLDPFFLVEARGCILHVGLAPDLSSFVMVLVSALAISLCCLRC